MQLLEERRLVAALEAELKRPVNVHRWRKLRYAEPLVRSSSRHCSARIAKNIALRATAILIVPLLFCSFPFPFPLLPHSDTSAETFGLVKRVHELQSEIIARADEVVDKDAAIQEKEKLYVDLRKVLARQPGPEATEQLRVFALTLKEKKSKFEAMKAELKMYQAKVYEYKYDIEKLNKDIELIKLSYFQQRRAQLAHQQKQQQQAYGGGTMGGMGYATATTPGGGIGGGGFDANAQAAYDAFAAQNAMLTAAALQAQAQAASFGGGGRMDDATAAAMQAAAHSGGGGMMPMDSASLAAAAAAAIAAANAATDAAAARGTMQFAQ